MKPSWKSWKRICGDRRQRGGDGSQRKSPAGPAALFDGQLVLPLGPAGTSNKPRHGRGSSQLHKGKPALEARLLECFQHYDPRLLSGVFHCLLLPSRPSCPAPFLPPHRTPPSPAPLSYSFAPRSQALGTAQHGSLPEHPASHWMSNLKPPCPTVKQPLSSYCLPGTFLSSHI